MKRSFGIVGGGIVGCATALFLKRAGHDVTVFERVETPRAVGAGLVLQPSGLGVLEKLGLREALEARGAKLRVVRCLGDGGRQIMALRYPQPYDHGLGIHRGILFETLYHAVLDAGIEYRPGHEALGIEQNGDIVFRTQNRERFTESRPTWIIANGAKSRLRNVFPVDLMRKNDWGALWTVVPDEAFGRSDVLEQRVRENEIFLGLLPIGDSPDGPGNHTSVFWSLPLDALKRWRERGVGVWVSEVAKIDERAAELLRFVHDDDPPILAKYRDVVMKRFVHQRGASTMIFVGDAAHAMSPQLGNGTNLGLLDAECLVENLDDLKNFERIRKKQVRAYGFTSRMLTPMFQGHSHVLSMFRDLAVPFAQNVWPFSSVLSQMMRGDFLLEREPEPSLRQRQVRGTTRRA